MLKVAMTRGAVIVAVVASVCVFLPTRAGEGPSGSITVVYNHEGPCGSGLQKQGGFSAFVRIDERSLLFDTGGEATVILENLDNLELNDAELEAIVISHNHWDHVYGLPGAMRSARNSPPVYVATSAAANLEQQFPSATFVAVEGPTQIAPGIWTTGPLEIEFMGATLSEQALVFEHPDGLHVIVGCSHPGIVEMVKRAKEMFPNSPVALVGGGFHLRSTGPDDLLEVVSELERLGVRKIAPSHCSGADAVELMRERWSKDFVSFELGDTYRF